MSEACSHLPQRWKSEPLEFGFPLNQFISFATYIVNSAAGYHHGVFWTRLLILEELHVISAVGHLCVPFRMSIEQRKKSIWLTMFCMQIFTHFDYGEHSCAVVSGSRLTYFRKSAYDIARKYARWFDCAVYLGVECSGSTEMKKKSLLFSLERYGSCPALCTDVCWTDHIHFGVLASAHSCLHFRSLAVYQSHEEGTKDLVLLQRTRSFHPFWPQRVHVCVCRDSSYKFWGNCLCSREFILTLASPCGRSKAPTLIDVFKKRMLVLCSLLTCVCRLACMLKFERSFFWW